MTNQKKMSMADIQDFCFLLTILASFYGPFKGKNIQCSIIYSIDLIFYLIIEFQEFEFFHFFLIYVWIVEKNPGYSY